MATNKKASDDVVRMKTEREEEDYDIDEEEGEEEDQNWEDWNAETDEECDENLNNNSSKMLCLFCESWFTSCDSLFQHCASFHNFDFKAIKKILCLDFYGCFKLINYIRSQVRTNAYRQAILENPSLLRGAVVMDVGCGTGILSLFAAQAGASRVIAVEASKKMASAASQIAKDNGLLWSESLDDCKHRSLGAIEVVHGMVEELENGERIEPHSVDVLLSEWMGYCLLYESMLSSVLFARDKWLKPGGAILPDTATMFVAGFGRGGTSLPFWENVYGFNMSCIGKEVIEDAAQLPLVDIIDGCDVVTNTEVLQTFDLVTLKNEEMDFTATVELAPKSDTPLNFSTELESKIVQCHGVVLWFETGFTERFCSQMPTILSTSPYNRRTHWSQTILTFKEPVVMALGEKVGDRSGKVGSDACPALRIQSRISIVRGGQHRSIDISMELSAIGLDGRKHSWPVQMFNL